LALTDDITELRNLFLRHDNIGKNFRINVRAYNSEFVFTSMGVKLDDNLASADHGLDQRIYNKPIASQVAAIWVEGNDSINYTECNIIVQSQSKSLLRVSEL
ncbi:827_t:CDS:2, partial [Gigaspora rosea]